MKVLRKYLREERTGIKDEEIGCIGFGIGMDELGWGWDFIGMVNDGI